MACSNPFTAMTNFLSLNFLNSMKSSGETNICLHTTRDFLDRSILWILPDQNRSLLFFSGNSDSLKKGNKFNEPCLLDLVDSFRFFLKNSNGEDLR